MNIDDNPQTPARYGVRGIPTLLIFRDGNIREQIVGAKSKAQLVKIVDRVLE